jgi:hypothetical protein
MLASNLRLLNSSQLRFSPNKFGKPKHLSPLQINSFYFFYMLKAILNFEASFIPQIKT